MAEKGADVEAHGGRRTVVVGVKLDSGSRELLTWALVKAALPGDRVVALHVLNTNEIAVDRDQNSCLLSTIKSFDSVIAVYEGFCNLKEVDLKLKFCKGSSVQKTLVREAKFYSAAVVIVGTARNHRTFRSTSSTSVAKYCAKKLPQDCSILAVDNGKIQFKRDAYMPSSNISKGIDCKQRRSIFSTIQRTLGKSTKERPKSTNVGNFYGSSELVKEKSSCAEGTFKKKCSLCSPKSVLDDCAMDTLKGSLDDQDDGKSMDSVDVQEGKKGALVPIDAGTFSKPCSPSNSTDLPDELEGFHEKYSATCRLFTYQELVQATSNFMTENLIGKGGSSRVYKGYLPDGKELAVKILKPCEDVLKEFVMEIEMITSLHHKNIISLFGYCFEDGNLILVYDFLSRGSVEDILYGNNKDPDIFGWSERYNVAVGVAEALEYLHGKSSKPVIHRDVKSSNILLFDDFEPQLSDFGFAKWALTTSSQVTCIDVAGTFGYLAPEYFMYGKVNDKIDVYAFGVVLLELLSGRKPICNDRPKGQESLVMWARPLLQGGKATQLLDPSLSNIYDGEEMERMVLAATLCIRRAPQARPQMTTVVKLLQGDSETTDWARLEVNISEGKDEVGDELSSSSSMQSLLDLALLDVEDDSLSSFGQIVYLEDYLQHRRSCSSSID